MIWLICLVNILGTAQNGWVQVESEAGHFKVLAPKLLKEHIISTKPDIGEVKYHIFSHEHLDTSGNSIIYQVSYYDYPVDFSLEDSVELKALLFEATIEEATASISGELVYAQDDFKYSYPGKFWRINYGDGFYIKTRAFFYGNRYYSIQIVGNEGNIAGIDERRFFNSFQLIY